MQFSRFEIGRVSSVCTLQRMDFKDTLGVFTLKN